MLRRLLIALFSAGWLVPLWISAYSMFAFCNGELWPRLRGEHPLNSFPFIRFSEQVFTFAFVWLAAVIAFWAWRLSDDNKTKAP